MQVLQLYIEVNFPLTLWWSLIITSVLLWFDCVFDNSVGLKRRTRTDSQPIGGKNVFDHALFVMFEISKQMTLKACKNKYIHTHNYATVTKFMAN